MSINILNIMKSTAVLNIYSRLLLSVAISISPTYSFAKQLDYVMQRNETVSDVLFRMGVTPIWGRKGYLEKTIQLNHFLHPTHANHVLPGQTIRLVLPDEIDHVTPAQAAAMAILKSEAEPAVKTPARHVANETESAPVVVPTPAPVAPVVINNSDDNSENEHLFSVHLIGGNSRIDSSDTLGGNTRATLLSEFNSGVNIKILFPMNDDSKFYGLLEILNEQYANFKTDITLTNSKVSRASYGFGYDTRLSEKWYGVLQVSQEQNLFLKGVSGTESEILKIPVSQWVFAFRRKMYQGKQLGVYAEAGLLYIPETSTQDLTISAGNGYFTGLSLQRTYRQKPVTLSFRYKNQSQNTNISKQSRSDLDLSVGTEF